MANSALDELCVNTIRFLSVDAVQKANSGHPGLPLDAAPMGYILWDRFLKYNPANPNWFDRDRFILSAGHGSMLQYSLLYLTGYHLSLHEIERFRQWRSETPGHPERRDTPGVEVTTGPLGQGFGDGLGMAIAEAYLAARYNRPGYDMINHYTYAIVSDGDLMEGVSSEAGSLAGELKLGKMIYLYDNNHITLSASTNINFTEDRAQRFEAFGWHTQTIDDGNDLEEIANAIHAAQQETERPSLILIRTHIGYGSPHKQDTFEAHGSPLGPEEVELTKENLGWPLDKPFYVPDQVLQHMRQAVDRGQKAEAEWKNLFAAYAQTYPDLAEELSQLIRGELPKDWAVDIPRFAPDPKGMATRVASGKTMNAIAPRLPGFIGGSGDLNPSTHSSLKDMGDFENPQKAIGDLQGSVGGGWSYAGRNLHFGVREHAMGTALNGIAAHGGLIPFGATFLIFSDYMRPPIRLASMMHLPVIYVFTHDSIGLGEDGPTHQPVEQLLGLRSIPGMTVIRPADANETASAWQVAIEHRYGPVAMVLTRQNVPILDLSKYGNLFEGVRVGGYILIKEEEVMPDIVLIATGSEVHLAVGAQEQLTKAGVQARVVSMPSVHLFIEEPDGYQDRVLPPNVPWLIIEAGSPLGWRSFFGRNSRVDVIGVDQFGASAPGPVVMREYGFTVENVYRHAMELLQRNGWVGPEQQEQEAPAKAAPETASGHQSLEE